MDQTTQRIFFMEKSNMKFNFFYMFCILVVSPVVVDINGLSGSSRGSDKNFRGVIRSVFGLLCLSFGSCLNSRSFSNFVYAHNMRINSKRRLNMSNPAPATIAATRKRAVNLTLNETLVAQAKTYTSNLSATMETLLADFVAMKQQARAARQQQADSCAADWNAVHALMGSFADEHSTL